MVADRGRSCRRPFRPYREASGSRRRYTGVRGCRGCNSERPKKGRRRVHRRKWWRTRRPPAQSEALADLVGTINSSLRNHDGKGAQRSNDGSPAWWRLKTIMKRILGLILLGTCLPLMSCAAGSRTFGETAADTLPTWLGGEPQGLSPRSGTPEYGAWMTKRAQQAAWPKDKQ